MPALFLTPAERKAHRAAAHHLHPVVAIGADGLTPAVTKEADAALRSHGLIKLRVFSDDRAARELILERLADALDAAPVQHIGKLLVLWRPLPETPRVERENRRAGPKVVKLIKFSKSGNHRPQVKKVTVMGNQRVTAGGSIKRAKKRAGSVKKAAQAN
jgi:putative YhbY family RNA-binding protein